MLRIFFALVLLGVCTLISVAGFRGVNFTDRPLQIFPDMKHQPKFQPQHSTTFFSDGRAARQPVAGTIPVGYTLPGRYFQAGARNVSFNSGFANLNDYPSTGRIGDVYGDGLPIEVSAALLDRGQERYNINCSICHGLTGEGNGVVQKIGAWATVANLQDDRIRTMPDGQIFNTITHGKNTMGAYGPNISVEDRWAIIAYLRALQKSQRVMVAELPADVRAKLQTAASK